MNKVLQVMGAQRAHRLQVLHAKVTQYSIIGEVRNVWGNSPKDYTGTPVPQRQWEVNCWWRGVLPSRADYIRTYKGGRCTGFGHRYHVV